MFAVIHRSTPPRGPGAFALAGLPLVLRQLQWLRDARVERVALELAPDGHGEEVRGIVTGHPVLARNVVFVRPTAPLPPSILGEQAGFPGGTRLLALPESVIGNADLAGLHHRGASRGVRVGRLAPPGTGGAWRQAEVYVVAPGPGPVEVELLSGWGTSIETRGDALRLASEALLGRLPQPREALSPSFLIHAAEQSPGVWVARGGRIRSGARVLPPVLVGPGAIVCSGARVGPGAFIGARAIIEPGALVERSLVDCDTVVGEGLELRDLLVTAGGLAPLDGDDPVTPLRDPLLLSHRRPPFWRRFSRP